MTGASKATKLLPNGPTTSPFIGPHSGCQLQLLLLVAAAVVVHDDGASRRRRTAPLGRASGNPIESEGRFFWPRGAGQKITADECLSEAKTAPGIQGREAGMLIGD